jgi:hypothetical protein
MATNNVFKMLLGRLHFRSNGTATKYIQDWDAALVQYTLPRGDWGNVKMSQKQFEWLLNYNVCRIVFYKGYPFQIWPSLYKGQNLTRSVVTTERPRSIADEVNRFYFYYMPPQYHLNAIENWMIDANYSFGVDENDLPEIERQRISACLFDWAHVIRHGMEVCDNLRFSPKSYVDYLFVQLAFSYCYFYQLCNVIKTF